MYLWGYFTQFEFLIFDFGWCVFLPERQNFGCVLNVRIKKECGKKKNRTDHATFYSTYDFLLIFCQKKKKKEKWREKKIINEANCWRKLQRFFFRKLNIFRPRDENVPVKERKFDWFFWKSCDKWTQHIIFQKNVLDKMAVVW